MIDKLEWHWRGVIFACVLVLALAAGVVALADVASVGETADRLERMQVTDTIPPPPKPSAAQTCNTLIYRSHQSTSAGVCFRAVTAERGWSAQRIESWFPFVIIGEASVIYGESRYCWHIRRGEYVEPDQICNRENTKRYLSRLGEDSGFGQATSSLWGRNGILCVDHGVCSSAQIIASPFTSMLYSIVIPIERLGSQPWCWSSWARDYHDCWRAPDR